jgi:hypothetical protein
VAASPFFGHQTEAPPEDTTTTTEPPTTTTTTTTTAGDAFVYATWQGDIYRQTVGGEPELVVHLPELPGLPYDGLNRAVDSQLAVSRDGSTVYLSRPRDVDDYCLHDLVALTIADGSIEALGPGYWPAISPDGTKLAFLEQEARTVDGRCPANLVVRDLASGAERRWSDPISHGLPGDWVGQPFLENFHWASDNRTLVVGAQTGREYQYTVDTEAPEGTLPLDSSAFADLPYAPAGPEMWRLIDVVDVDGAPAALLVGHCRGVPSCTGQGDLLAVPLDGSPTASGSVDPEGSGFVYGPAGYLYAGPCDPTTADCYGAPLWYQSLSGDRVELVPEHLVIAHAWLP